MHAKNEKKISSVFCSERALGSGDDDDDDGADDDDGLQMRN